MKKIPDKVWQQFENIRASGDCSMFDQNCVFSAAMKARYNELTKMIVDKRYVEVVSGYSQAIKEKKFQRRKIND